MSPNQAAFQIVVSDPNLGHSAECPESMLAPLARQANSSASSIGESKAWPLIPESDDAWLDTDQFLDDLDNMSEDPFKVRTDQFYHCRILEVIVKDLLKVVCLCWDHSIFHWDANQCMWPLCKRSSWEKKNYAHHNKVLWLTSSHRQFFALFERSSSTA